MGVPNFSWGKSSCLASVACEPRSQLGPVIPVRGLTLIHLSQASPVSLKAEGCPLGGGLDRVKQVAKGARLLRVRGFWNRQDQGDGCCAVLPPVLLELEHQQGPGLCVDSSQKKQLIL